MASPSPAAAARGSRSRADEPAEREPAFAPVIVTTCPAVQPAALLPGHIEIVIGDCIVRVLGQVEAGTRGRRRSAPRSCSTTRASRPAQAMPFAFRPETGPRFRTLAMCLVHH
jgi:hypothetical protein